MTSNMLKIKAKAMNNIVPARFTNMPKVNMLFLSILVSKEKRIMASPMHRVKIGSSKVTVLANNSIMPYCSVVSMFVYKGKSINDIILDPKLLSAISEVFVNRNLYLFSNSDHLTAHKAIFYKRQQLT
jgi:hypothetical protein